jgi:unsaturated rhamnogalacturonyl hydrolase
VARQFLLAARHLRDPATGLFYHGWDATRSQTWADPKTGVSRVFWGRAVGWYLMACARCARRFAEDASDRAEIVRITQELAEAVAAVQDPVSGVWWQVLDQPNRERNYLEASGSSMFAYAFAKVPASEYFRRVFARARTVRSTACSPTSSEPTPTVRFRSPTFARWQAWAENRCAA